MQEISRCKPILENPIDTAIEKQLAALAIDNPTLDKILFINKLNKNGFSVSAGGFRGI